MVRRSKADAKKTREQLIETATALFQTKGYTDTSIKDICENLGITKGALFHHFQSKKDLFLEVWTRLQIEMDDAARDAAIAARSSTDPYRAFLAGSRVYLQYAMRQDYRKIVLTDGPAVLGQEVWNELDSDLGTQNVRAGVAYLAKKGIVAEHRVDALALMLQSALNGAGFALAKDEDSVTFETVHEAFELMLRSMR